MLKVGRKDLDQGLLEDGSHITVVVPEKGHPSSLKKVQPMWVKDMMNLPAETQQRLANKIQDLNKQFEDRYREE